MWTQSRATSFQKAFSYRLSEHAETHKPEPHQMHMYRNAWKLATQTTNRCKGHDGVLLLHNASAGTQLKDLKLKEARKLPCHWVA
jgi:hypothetical protein